MNVNKVLEELKTCGVDEYDIRDVAVKAIRKEFSKRYKIYLNDKSIDRWNINTIEESIKSIYDKHIKIFGDMETARVFYEFISLRCSLHHITDKDIEIGRYTNSSNAEIINIVRYSITGNIEMDYSEAYKVLDNHVPRIKHDMHMFELHIDNVKIKSFKNGKVQITGLTQEQKDRLRYGFDVAEKYRNVQI